MAILLFFLHFKKARKLKKKGRRVEEREEEQQQHATAEGLGKGNFGDCYKAVMDGKETVVVKRIRDSKPLSSEEFTRQLHIISHQKQPNLLPLLAC